MKNDRQIGVRISKKLYERVERFAKRMSEKTGFPVSHSMAMRHILETELARFEELERLEKEAKRK